MKRMTIFRIKLNDLKGYFLCIFCVLLLPCGLSCRDKQSEKTEASEANASFYREEYRPQFHFSPEAHWMNDPNGLVYYNGTYHLFYQYYPQDIVWGPMHWGHAVSKDLVFWEHRPIALYPDENGYIFSGSAVVDEKNTSGFGNGDRPPLVAVFTYHNIEVEKAGETNYQTQGIAYSLDEGESWIKFQGNPVIPNADNQKDFRDPKVFWHEPSGQWIMVLVAGDHAEFYRSADLKSWEYMSSFGKDHGAHGGVWECPDLFPLSVEGSGRQKWVLLVSINPGAPNGGSGTQYFIGDFDGNAFTSPQKEEKWIDWGRDDYAGVTYNNIPTGERIFIGWMSNWDYAITTPTKTWRSAMTLPRSLTLRETADGLTLASTPLVGLGTILKSELEKNVEVPPGQSTEIAFDDFNQSQLLFTTSGRNFGLSFTNEAGDTLKLGLNGAAGQFMLDRRASGHTDFDPDFAGNPEVMPLDGLPEGPVPFRILMDWSSIEIFIDDGEYVMTAQVFPHEHYTNLLIKNSGGQALELHDLELSRAETIWGYTPE